MFLLVLAVQAPGANLTELFVININSQQQLAELPATGILLLAQWEGGREAGVREQYLEDAREKSLRKEVSLAPLPTEKVIFILGQRRLA